MFQKEEKEERERKQASSSHSPPDSGLALRSPHALPLLPQGPLPRSRKVASHTPLPTSNGHGSAFIMLDLLTNLVPLPSTILPEAVSISNPHLQGLLFQPLPYLHGPTLDSHPMPFLPRRSSRPPS